MATQAAPPKRLVIEDDESLTGALERLLGHASFAAVAYGSAEELLTGPSAENAAWIVCDLRLPAMSGLAQKATRRGTAGYLVTPFHGTALLAAVKTAIAAEATP